MLNTTNVLSTIAMVTAASCSIAAPNVNSLTTLVTHQNFKPQLHVSLGSSLSPYFEDDLTSIISGYNTDTDIQTNAVNAIDKIKALKVALGLPNTAISDIMKITRQTLHSYVNTPGYDKGINAKTLTRVIELENVTLLINKNLNRSPGALSKNISLNGSSLFDLLKSDQLELDKIESVIDLLAEKMSNPKGLPFNQQTLQNLTSST